MWNNIYRRIDFFLSQIGSALRLDNLDFGIIRKGIDDREKERKSDEVKIGIME